MEVFTQIDGARAIVRYSKGVHKQVQLYRRRDRVYIPHGGGFVEVRHRDLSSESLTTGHPDVKVLEYDEAPGIGLIPDLGLTAVRWVAK